MASYTIRDFTEVVGLGKDRDSVIRAGIFLKALCGLGIAKETGTKRQGTGRPAAVYEVPDPIMIPLDFARGLKTEDPVEEPSAVAVPAVSSSSYFYDDEEED